MTGAAADLLTLHAAVAVGSAAVVAALVGGVTGGGVTAILLPILVLYVGIQEAVPIVTIALIAASVSRVAVYRRDLDLPVVGWFCLGSVPATVAGTLLFTGPRPGSSPGSSAWS